MPKFLEQLGLEEKFKEVIGELAVKNGGENVGVTRFRASIPQQELTEKNETAIKASLYYVERNRPNDTSVNVDANNAESTPTSDQVVTAQFRALSQSLLQSRGLDFSVHGVLKRAVSLLQGKPVFPNHDISDINNTLGVVSKVWWDEAGNDSNGVPGINCEIKIDALMNLLIARGLMMQPPSINRMSLTVLFEFDYSHPRLVEEHKFWSMIGEEVDGEIVRLIVTKIIDIWEASLVFLGEDRLAKGLPKDPEETDESLNAGTTNLSADENSAPNPNEENMMKLTDEQKTALGFDAALEDISGEQVLGKAVELAGTAAKFDGIDLEELQSKAEVSDKYLELQRTEVRRLAKLAELGAEEGDLDEVVEDSIKEANFDRLISLQGYYDKKVAERFPEKLRSSDPNSADAEKAGGIESAENNGSVPQVGLH